MLKAEMIIKPPTAEEYFNRFYEVFAEKGDCSYKEAWEALEIEYFDVFGQNRYTSYESFRTSKWRYLKKLINNG